MATILSDLQRQLVGTFFEESFEGLERFEAGLLALDQGEAESTETIHELFRVAHSIKGGAGSFGLHAVTELAHNTETVLDAMRSGTLAPSKDLCAVLLLGVDALRSLLTTLRDGGQSSSGTNDALCARLRGLASTVAAQPARPAPEPVKPAEAKFEIRFASRPGMFDSGNEAVRLFRELGRLGTLSSRVDLDGLPAFAELDPARAYLAWDLVLEGSVTRAQIDEVFMWIEGDADVTIREIAPEAEVQAAPELEVRTAKPADAPSPTPPTETAPKTSAARAESESLGSVRVAVDKIDLLMNMVGELVITQSILGELDGDGPIDTRRLERLREGLSQLARNTRQLQESVMRLRSIPISVVFNRFPRLVHDLCRKLDKQVELKIAGETTELDKTVLEKLGDPLVHLVRNSLDHGIEPAAVRAAAGKPPVGTITLRAYHRGGDIVVEVADDGKGINREKVIQRGRETGLLSPDEIPGDDVVRDLIFSPGFSTAASVTDVSGRGVGMDVVRRNVKSLGGDVFLETTPGKGTRITLRLPLTLAIIDGQLIRLGEHVYVLPLLSIVESVQVDRKQVRRFEGKHDLYRLRDELVPMVDLGHVLGAESSATGDKLLVIVESDHQRFGLLVDELLAQQQVVVKSLESNYGRVSGIAGATILGDGAVSLILDVASIGRMVRSGATRGLHAA